MRKLAWWFCMFGMTLRRALYRPVFLLFLLLFPLGMGVLHQVEKRSSGRIAVALRPGTDAWNQALAERLESEESSSFFFYPCGTEEEAKKAVMTGRAECAYLFPEGLKERLDEGHYTRAVRVLVSPSTVAERIISEKIFSELFEVYGRELLADYGKNGAAFQTVMARCQTTEAREKACGVLMKLYEKYRSNGSTFTFDYQTLQGGTALQTGAMKVVFPVRGLTAVFLFIMGLAAAVMAGEDAERGLYAAVRSRERWLLQTAEIAAFVFLASISAYAALLASGNGAEPLLEAGKLLFYLVFVTMYAFGCLAVCRKPGFLAALIPVFILACLLLCPIFFDASVFLPGAAGMRKLLPPWWYLSGIFGSKSVYP